VASAHTITSQFRGDTFAGLLVTIYTDSTQTTLLDLTGGSVRMDFRQNNKLTLQLSEGAGIEITNAAGGQVTAADFLLDMPVGEHDYDVEVRTADGRVITALYGTIEIMKDQTR